MKIISRKDYAERIDAWLDTPGSGFVTAFEAFWNGWASARDNMKCVVCGSATSWIMDNMIDQKGGLYDRQTSYLDKFSKGLSLAQNIDRLMFNRNARLRNEFERLFGASEIRPWHFGNRLYTIGMDTAR